jgi:thymidylate kinase
MSYLISVEGVDGAGKSTLVNELVNLLHAEEKGHWVYASKEPGSPWAYPNPKIREMVLETPNFKPFERELLFYVDASVHSRFMDNQGDDTIVVSDRGLWTHHAYLRAYLKTKQIDWDEYAICTRLIERTSKKPDIVIYIDGDTTLMRERNAGKKVDAIEKNGNAYFDAVLETFRDLVQERTRLCKPLICLDGRASFDENVIKSYNYIRNVRNVTNEGNQ